MSLDQDSLPDDQPKVFLSYSRRDRERAQRVAEVLRERAFGVYRDTDDILPTEEWRGRLEQLIEEADTIVFLLSPHSARSEVCAWEVDLASALGKRIAPIVIEEVEAGDIPPRLAELNFIFATERDPFDNAVDTLVSALNTDIEWIREHTRLNGLALRWQRAGRPSRLLLRGADIADAETWRDSRPDAAPAVTALQAGFVHASRLAASRRQRNAIAGALAGLALAASLAGLAYWQRGVAVQNEARARHNEALARATEQRASEARDDAWRTQTAILGGWAREAVDDGDHMTATLLLLAALPDSSASAYRTDAARPTLADAEAALYRLHLQRRELALLQEPATGPGQPARPLQLAEALFSDDGRRLLVRTVDGRAQLRDARTGGLLQALDRDGAPVLAIAFSADGQRLATLADGHRPVIWNAATGARIAQLDGCQARVHDRFRSDDMAFSADGRLLVTAGAALCVWDSHRGALLRAVTGTAGGHYRDDVGFGTDARTVLSSAFDARSVYLTHLDDGRESVLYRGIGGVHLQVNADRSRAVIADVGTVLERGGRPSRTELWDIAAGRRVALLSANQALLHSAFSPDGQALVASDGQVLRLWHGRTGSLLPYGSGLNMDREFLVQHDQPLGRVQWSGDGRLVIGSDARDQLLVWNLQGAPVLRLRQPPLVGEARAQFAVSPDLGRVLTFRPDGVATLWSVARPASLRTLEAVTGSDGEPLLDAGQRQRVASYFQTRMQHLLSGEDWPPRESSEVARIEQAGGSLVASWQRGTDSTVRIDGGATVQHLRGHTAPVHSAAFRPGTAVLATVAADGLRSWDARSGELLASLPARRLSGAAYRVREVGYSDDGARLVVLSEDFVDVLDAATLGSVVSLVADGTFALGNPPADYFDASEGVFLDHLEDAQAHGDGEPDTDASQPRFWHLLQPLQALVEHEKRAATRCLSRRQMQRYFLGETPPRWCITGPGLEDERDPRRWRPKPPYQDTAWRDWLVARDRGEQAPVPPGP